MVGGDASVLLHGAVSGAGAAGQAGGEETSRTTGTSRRHPSGESGKALSALPEALAVGLRPGTV